MYMLRCTNLRVFQVVTKQWWIQIGLHLHCKRGGGYGYEFEFCEDNSGSTQQVPFFQKNKGGGGGGCPPASPLDPPLESVLVVPGMYKQTL